MLKISNVSLALALSASTAAADTSVRITSAGEGVIRLQRIESSMVITDVFAGLVGDIVTLPPGTYRVQAVSPGGALPHIAFGEFEVGGNGDLKATTANPPFSSLAYRDRAAVIEHSPVTFDTMGVATVRLDPSKESARKKVIVRPPMRATNWTSNLSKLRGISVNIDSNPADAEIWIDGELSTFRTDASIVIPLRADGSLRKVDILIRKAGYANRILQVDASVTGHDVRVELAPQ